MRPLSSLILAALIVPAAALAQEKVVDTPSGRIKVETVAGNLDHPWALEFLPDGRMLVTERPGRLRIVSQDGRLSEPLDGLPQIYSEGQGGLLDITLDPDFQENQQLYFSFSEEGEGGAGTAVARGRLVDNRLEDVQVIFRQQPKVSGSKHFGSRLAFAPDGKLFVTLAERFKFDPAQDLTNHLGAVVRINPDGSVPQDNPFVGRQNARPEIWSYGHRNIQAAALQPDSNTLWIAEMGPRNGDELNIPEAGKNYGWPVVSWGRHYDGTDIPDPPTRPEFAQAIHHWTPVISPSGMTFYTGDLFSDWRGSLLIGGLSAQGVVRLTLDGRQVTDEERISLNQRIREVQQGPDGAIYVVTDESSGEILRLTPAGSR
ncbi:PQQ-dependent sugar dehydrogenase [Microvirga sp. SM9]|nr:PQQ-dependent sugar dehydrogenase [Microvirga lenta]MCB5175159.1 PQQ-dependent sugar dehydrogenase [Microvirga lenta]